eukprot:1601156-Prymnesium_polylepis.1
MCGALGGRVQGNRNDFESPTCNTVRRRTDEARRPRVAAARQPARAGLSFVLTLVHERALLSLQ